VVRELCDADWTHTMDAAWSTTLVDLDTYVGHGQRQHSQAVSV
jgi:hypothetical protein